jgi:PEP-CTERM motif
VLPSRILAFLDNEPNKALAPEGNYRRRSKGRNIMAFAVSKQRCSAILAVSSVVAGVLMGSAWASVIESSPSFPPIPLSFESSTGVGCFSGPGVCVIPGIFTLTSAHSTFSSLPAVQDVEGNATFTGSLTASPPNGTPPLPFTLMGPVGFEVFGRGSDTETGTWDTQITSLSLTGTLLGGTLTAVLDTGPNSQPSTGGLTIEQLGRDEFRITSFFDVFIDLRLPPFATGVGPIHVVAVGVPEPATWAMMLLSFAGLGFAGRRRARTALT